jgi:hypothetical protein
VSFSFKLIGKEAAEDGLDISQQYLNVSPMTVKEPSYMYSYPAVRLSGNSDGFLRPVDSV